jgi:hypothetical protein
VGVEVPERRQDGILHMCKHKRFQLEMEEHLSVCRLYIAISHCTSSIVLPDIGLLAPRSSV